MDPPESFWFLFHARCASEKSYQFASSPCGAEVFPPVTPESVWVLPFTSPTRRFVSVTCDFFPGCPLHRGVYVDEDIKPGMRGIFQDTLCRAPTLLPFGASLFPFASRARSGFFFLKFVRPARPNSLSAFGHCGTFLFRLSPVFRSPF